MLYLAFSSRYLGALLLTSRACQDGSRLQPRRRRASFDRLVRNVSETDCLKSSRGLLPVMQSAFYIFMSS